MSGRQIDASYLVPDVCQAAGISYRQLDYWDATNLVKPSKAPARGSGSARVYSFQDVVMLRVIKKLLDTGVSLQRVRGVMGYLRDCDDMRVSLISDGTKIAPYTDLDGLNAVVDYGRAWFAINVDVVWTEMELKLGLRKKVSA